MCVCDASLGPARASPEHSLGGSEAEGASMVRWAPFPLSRMPASIEHSMKLLCVCDASLGPAPGLPGPTHTSARRGVDGGPHGSLG